MKRYRILKESAELFRGCILIEQSEQYGGQKQYRVEPGSEGKMKMPSYMFFYPGSVVETQPNWFQELVAQ